MLSFLYNSTVQSLKNKQDYFWEMHWILPIINFINCVYGSGCFRLQGSREKGTEEERERGGREEREGKNYRQVLSNPKLNRAKNIKS